MRALSRNEGGDCWWTHTQGDENWPVLNNGSCLFSWSPEDGAGHGCDDLCFKLDHPSKSAAGPFGLQASRPERIDLVFFFLHIDSLAHWLSYIGHWVRFSSSCNVLSDHKRKAYFFYFSFCKFNYFYIDSQAHCLSYIGHWAYYYFFSFYKFNYFYM